MVPPTDRQIRQVSYNGKAYAVARLAFSALLICFAIVSNLVWGDPESPTMVILSGLGVLSLMAILFWIMARNGA